MLKIHSGIYKGQKIARVHSKTTKETASMVREAVFNSLFKISGHVLDLFAGSGSYGITALSLGANKATFVDNNFKAYKTVNSNLEKLNIKADVFLSDYQTFLNKNTTKFDLIFLDPPYNFKNYEQLLNELSNHLNENAKIVLEIDKKTQLNNDEINFNKSKEKVYGSKKVIIYECL